MKNQKAGSVIDRGENRIEGAKLKWPKAFPTSGKLRIVGAAESEQDLDRHTEAHKAVTKRQYGEVSL